MIFIVGFLRLPCENAPLLKEEMKNKESLNIFEDYVYNIAMGKNERIKQSIKETKERRKTQSPKVCMQDENIRGWKSGLFGKRIQHTSIGGITSRLKNNLKTPVLIDRFVPTTQTCSHCRYKQKMSLLDRVFKCETCGFEIDRDINSARNMVLLGENTPKNLSLDWAEVTPVEKKVSMRILESNPYISISCASLKQEAFSFN